MKRLSVLIFGFSFLAVSILSPGLVFAVSVNDTVNCSEAPQSAFCKQTSQSTTNPIFGPKGILTKGATLLAIATGVVSVFMIVFGGLKFVLSAGDVQKINTARNTILYASIGVAIAVSAGAIVQFILKKL